jgi:hypothetical protein
MATTTTKKTVKPMPTHVDRTAVAYTGPLKVDATAVGPLLQDLPPGARKGLRTAHVGIDDVLAEVAAASPAAQAAAGIPAALMQSYTTQNTNITALTQEEQVTAKLAEVMGESLALMVDAREQQLSQMGDAVRSTAKRTKNDGVKAPFQKLLAYLGEGATKAVKTRKAKKAAAATGTTTPAATTPAATTAAATTAAATTPATTAAGH